MRNLHAYIQKNFAASAYDLHLIEHRGDRVYVARNAEITLLAEGEDLPGPLLSLSTETAQMLIDELYRAGLRPTDAIAADATLAAKDAHIKDLGETVRTALQLVNDALIRTQ